MTITSTTQDTHNTLRAVECRREAVAAAYVSAPRCDRSRLQGADSCATPESLIVPMDRIFHRQAVHLTNRTNLILLSHAVARAVFEIIAGYRSVTQLNFVMDPECILKLRNRALLETEGYSLMPAPGTTHGQVQSMRLRSASGGAWECTIILGFKYRVRAVALRIEPWHGRWQVTSLEML